MSTSKWQEMYGKLVAFHRKYGHCNVPQQHKEFAGLGRWVSSLRQRKRNSSRAGAPLSKEQEDQLKALGFVWFINAADRNFNTMMSLLEEYKNKHGDCLVPADCKVPKLAAFVEKQRTLYWTGELESERKERLNSIGFSWTREATNNTAASKPAPTISVKKKQFSKKQVSQPSLKKAKKTKYSWDEMYKQLVAYRRKHGHCMVPQRGKKREFSRLGTWVATQRKRKRGGKEPPLSQQEEAKLNALGFVWYVSHSDRNFNTMLPRLQHYRNKHGNCLVPPNYSKDPQLATWVEKQRVLYSQGKLESDQENRLNSVGFSWSGEAATDVAKKKQSSTMRVSQPPLKKARGTWNEQYEKLVQFHAKYGHCLVPQIPKTEFPGLGSWVSTQRQRKRGSGNSLSQEEETKLNALGFVWYVNHSDRNFNTMMSKLEEYKKKHGNCMVSAECKVPKLAAWVEKQRELYWTGELESDRKNRLNNMGFSWSTDGSGEVASEVSIPTSPSKKRASQPSSSRPKKKQKKLKLSPSEFLQSRVQQQWNESFDRLVKFKRAYGHFHVPPSWREDTSLSSWIQEQQENRHSMDPSQQARLESIGFPWNEDDYETVNETSDYDTDELLESVRNGVKYAVGTKVKMFVQGSGWVSGKVSQASADSHYRVRYDTGRTLEYSEYELDQIVVSPEHAKVKVGSRISVQWPADGKFYEGAVTRECNEQRQNYLFSYDSGEYEWLDLFRRSFRLVKETSMSHDQHQHGSLAGSFDIGTKVKKFFPGYGWFEGQVTSYSGVYYTVTYSDGDREEYTEQTLAEIALSPKLAVVDIDTVISLQWPNNNNFYRATVILERSNKEASWCVVYENDQIEWVNLQERKFRLVGKGTRMPDHEETSIKVGNRVAVQWSDGIFYGATVTHKKEGRYTLKYDDDDTETTDFVQRDYRLLRREK